MKRLAFWGAVGIGTVIVQMAVTFWFLAPHIDNYLYRVTWSEGLLAGDMDTATGWRVLTPHYAWPILVTYLGPLVAVGSVIALAIGCSIVLRERQVIARREAAADLQEAQVRIDAAEAECIRKAAQNREQEVREEVARCKPGSHANEAPGWPRIDFVGLDSTGAGSKL